MKIIESDFEYKGYRCITIFTEQGIRCGYVGVPCGHPLYGMEEHSRLKCTNKDIENMPFGKRSPLQIFRFGFGEPEDYVPFCMYFDVHGGITYIGGGKDSTYPIDSDLWWIGFDCAHAGDGRDFKLLRQLHDNVDAWHISRVESILKSSFAFEDDVVRTLDYVQDGCRNLVDQIISYVDIYERQAPTKLYKREIQPVSKNKFDGVIRIITTEWFPETAKEILIKEYADKFLDPFEYLGFRERYVEVSEEERK